ncbi:MAG: vWA domain-containing protein [Vulcanimicrobiaceae bacterium]
MSFEHAWRLVPCLLVAASLLWLLDRAQRREHADALVYSDIDFLTHAVRARAWIPRAMRALVVAGVALLALAAAGPRLLLPVPVHDGYAFICIDTSGSMQSTDVAPDRADAAKSAARAFIEQAAPGTHIGIISFATAASIVQPLTTDRAQAIGALADVPYPNGATAIGDALRLAAQALPPSGHRVIVLITDGVNNTGTDPAVMAQWLGAHHIPVYTVGIGTNNGSIIPGTTEQATIDEQALRAYANESGGAYARAGDAAQLEDVLARLGRIVSLERQPVDVALPAALLGGGALLIVLLALLGLGRVP